MRRAELEHIIGAAVIIALDDSTPVPDERRQRIHAFILRDFGD
jgi:hypothetical protein